MTYTSPADPPEPMLPEEPDEPMLPDEPDDPLKQHPLPGETPSA